MELATAIKLTIQNEILKINTIQVRFWIADNDSSSLRAVRDYLKKSFNHAVAQNVVNGKSMTAAIKNISHHCFNDHLNCGDGADT